jgi:hypothetical protein
MTMAYTVKCCGAGSAEPGPGAVAFAVHDGTRVIHAEARGLDGVTQHEADFMAVIAGLTWLHDQKITYAKVCTDSSRVYRVALDKTPALPLLAPLRQEVRDLMMWTCAELAVVPGSQNRLAQMLAKACLPAKPMDVTEPTLQTKAEQMP